MDDSRQARPRNIMMRVHEFPQICGKIFRVSRKVCIPDAIHPADNAIIKAV